jgi:hypothetical protein
MPIAIKETVTHIAVAIDSSGSMQTLSKRAVDTYNEIVETLQNSSKSLNQKVFLSLYTFGGNVQNLFKHRAIENVSKLRYNEFRADGGTPMLECAWKAVTDLQSYDGPDVANSLTVITDGEENQSSHQSKQAFIGSIKGLLATDRWTITFSVPRGGTYLLTGFGIPAGNIQEWDQTEAGMKGAGAAIASGYAQYLGLRSQGVTSTKGFFTAGVNAQQAKQAKSKLDDVRADFKEMTVRTQDPKTLQEFIEARGLTFTKGKAFYQLTKAEKVQASKEVLLREIKSGAVYGGRSARDILGLPDGIDVKVKPTDHGDWDVFVQSTSNNRKLVNGTNLLYLK